MCGCPKIQVLECTVKGWGWVREVVLFHGKTEFHFVGKKNGAAPGISPGFSMLKVRSTSEVLSRAFDTKSLEKNNCSVGRCHPNGDYSGQGGPSVGPRSELIRGLFNTRLGLSNKPLGSSAAVLLDPERLRTVHY